MKKRGKRSAQRGANRILKGLRLSWEEQAESAKTMAGDITDASITHANPNYRPVCKSMWVEWGLRIYQDLPLLWKIKVTAVFTAPDAPPAEEEFSLIDHALLVDLGNAVQPLFDTTATIAQELALESGHPYRHTHYRWELEVIGNRPPKSTDYEE